MGKRLNYSVGKGFTKTILNSVVLVDVLLMAWIDIDLLFPKPYKKISYELISAG